MPHTILYVEDETAIVELMQMILAHPEIRLLAANTASEGLAKAREMRPELVIMDVMMPDRSGWSLYEDIRADPNLNSTPVIILTAQLHRYRIMKEFSRSPIDAYITKPFDASALRGEIERMLGKVIWSRPVVPPAAKPETSVKSAG